MLLVRRAIVQSKRTLSFEFYTKIVFTYFIGESDCVAL